MNSFAGSSFFRNLRRQWLVWVAGELLSGEAELMSFSYYLFITSVVLSSQSYNCFLFLAAGRK